MLLPSGTAISKCCGAVVYEHDDKTWHCMKCFQPCETAGTIGDLWAVENQRRELEHSLATAFVKWTKERDPTERGILWLEMHETAKKLEQLNAD